MDVKEAQEMYREAETYWGPIYRAGKDDLRFCVGEDHWSPEDVSARKGRPCLVVNQLPQFIHQVTNDMRQNTPSINVLPVGDGSDEETAKTLKGLIRNIEYESGADEVYDTAGEYSVKCSLGWIRVDHDFEAPDSFVQRLMIKRVNNPFMVLIDPSTTECDGSDAEYGFALDTYTKKQFEREFPKKSFVSFDTTQPADNKTESIIVAELFIKEYEEVQKVQTPTGEIMDFIEGMEGKLRTFRKTIIKRYLMSGADILRETTFPGTYIPLIPVYGEEVWVDGKRVLLSLIRQSKDAQRRYNHWISKESELLAMAPISPVVAAEGQIEDYMDEWQSPGSSMVLRYRQKDADENPAPPPQRLAPPSVPTGIINAAQGAKEDIKATMGLYDASIGKKSNETSGVAIQARKQEGDVATFHFADNRNRSIAHVGRVLVSAIPQVYDSARILRIIGEEEDPQMVAINGAPPPQGQKRSYDLTKGRYDVRITTGPSYTTKRQEAAAFMADMVKAAPNLMNVAGDLLVKNMDLAGSDVLASRLRKMVPPELTAEEDAKKTGEQAPTPREMQMMQVIQQLQAKLAEVMPIAEGKQAELEMKAQENASDAQMKQQELALKEQEIAINAQLEQQKLENERIKLSLEARKLDIEHERMEREERLALSTAFMPPESGHMDQQVAP